MQWCNNNYSVSVLFSTNKVLKQKPNKTMGKRPQCHCFYFITTKSDYNHGQITLWIFSLKYTYGISIEIFFSWWNHLKNAPVYLWLTLHLLWKLHYKTVNMQKIFASCYYFFFHCSKLCLQPEWPDTAKFFTNTPRFYMVEIH